MTDTAEAGAIGFPPSLRIEGPVPQPGHSDPKLDTSKPLTEAEKYARMWEHEQYRAVAPGESCAMTFVQQACPKPGSTIIDFGAGTGRGALMLCILAQAKVRMLDFAPNCLDEDVSNALTTQAHCLSFEQHDLTQPVPGEPERYGYCTDVLEHIPPEQVDTVLTNVLKAAQHVFLQISCVDDVCGALIGQPLHLSVHPFDWWLKKLRDEFECTIHWCEDRGSHCMFYVSAWWDGMKLAREGILNVEHETMRANVLTNVKREGVRQVAPHEINSFECMILGGGPSLSFHENTIREMRAEGAKLVTLNGAYCWAVERGIVPISATVICDARPHNERFVRPFRPETKYLLASQCDPSLYETLAPAIKAGNLWQWHTTAEDVRDILDEHIPLWYGVPGGSTVLLRSLPLLRMLGYRRFHLFGCDSCLTDNQHHAYEQPENDGLPVFPVMLGERRFWCNPWHIAQAAEFIELIKFMGDQFEITAHGDGLLAWILEHAADVDLADEVKRLKAAALE